MVNIDLLDSESRIRLVVIVTRFEPSEKFDQSGMVGLKILHASEG